MRTTPLKAFLFGAGVMAAMGGTVSTAAADYIIQKVCKTWYTRVYFCCSNTSPCKQQCYQDQPKYECRLVRSEIPKTKVDVPPPPPSDPRPGRPASGGILEADPAFGSQGPAATGTPLTPRGPATAVPVIR